MRKTRRRCCPAVLTGLLVLLTNCGTTADIQLRDHTVVRGTIIGGDGGERGNVYLADRRGLIRALDREDIEDLDHPGSVAAALGAVVTLYGALSIMVGSSRCDASRADVCVGVFAPVVLGVPLLIYGASVYQRSLSALNKPYAGALVRRLIVSPTFNVANRWLDPGLLLGARF